MPRLLLIISLIPIVIAFVVRWWFGTRIITTLGHKEAQCNLDKWQNTFGSDLLPPSNREKTVIYAELVRKSALLEWKIRDPKAAKSREAVRNFGMAVPPLSLMCAVMGFFVGSITISVVILIFLIALALASTFAYLSIGQELQALLITSRRLRDARVFPRSDDESAVLNTATALCWKEAAPPIFKLIQK